MTARAPDEIINKAVELYTTGKSLREISEVLGFNENTISKHFKNRGFKTRKTSEGRQAPNKINNLPESQICQDYQKGESENSISKTYGVSRNVIRRILLKHNIQARNQSESEKVKWSRMSSEQRENQVRSAHQASKGIIRSDEAKRKVAASREANTPDWYIGCGEPEFKKWLTDKKIEFSYQKAVEFYNIDFLINNVAVELTSFVGRNKITKDDFMRRASILNDFGIKTLAVEFKDADSLIENADLILSIVEKISLGEYDPVHYMVYRLQDKSPRVLNLA